MVMLARAPWTVAGARAVLTATALPTAATWALEALNVVSPSNAVRALAALPLGAAVAAVTIAVSARRLR
jgi:hypothetical protein